MNITELIKQELLERTENSKDKDGYDFLNGDFSW